MARLPRVLAGVVAVFATLAVAGSDALAASTTLTTNGGWSWFGDPRAVHHEGTKRQTYTGWIDNAGNVKVASVDADGGPQTTATIAIGVHVDDHANPSLLVLPDGRIVAFWAWHSGSKMEYRITSAPEDVSAWGPVRTVSQNVAGPWGYTYPNPVHLPAENRHWLFWRGGDALPTFSTSTDLSTWAAARTLIKGETGQRPYVKFAGAGGDTIHFAFTRSHPNEGLSGIYYLRYRAGVLTQADGTRVAGMDQLPVAPTQADSVYAPLTGGTGSWIHDIAVDANGRPVIVYARFPTTDDHRYHYARWTGSQWLDREITPAGPAFPPPPKERYYSGGISIDKEDPSVVYLSRRVGSAWEVERWTTSDGGATWSSSAVTSASSELNVRPVTPLGSKGAGTNVLWMRGTYTHYTDFATAIAAELESGGNRPPTAVASASPTSGAEPLGVQFRGSDSSDPDGDALEYDWDFGDGSAHSSEANPQHTYDSGGSSYTATLTVRDGNGNQDSDSVTIRPGEPEPEPSNRYSEAVLASSGLASYWRLGESSGTSAADSKGSNHGTYAGGATLGRPGALDGDPDTAAGFDGQNDELTLPGPALSTRGTVEGWFRWQTGGVLLRDTTTAGGWILAYDNAGRIAYRVGGVTFTTTLATGALRDGAWHHVAVTVAGGAASLFVDGALVRRATGAGTTRSAGAWHAMRNGGYSQFTQGDADELAIYTEALSAAAIADHYAAHVPGPAPSPPGYSATVLGTSGLLSYWRLGEATGTTAADAKGTNTGTFVGGPLMGQPGALSGDSNTAVGFDGVNDYASFPGTALAVAGQGTIEGWFKWAAGGVVFRDSTSSGGWILAFDNAGSLAFRVGGVTFATTRSTTSVRDGNWHHLALTASGGSASLYMDGALVRSATGAGTARAVVPWRAMRNGLLSGYARGSADELAIYNRALTAAEVQQHYAAR